MLKVLALVFFLVASGEAFSSTACVSLARKECRQSAECRWQKAKKACVEKKQKQKSAKVKKKEAKKSSPAEAKEPIDNDFSTESDDVGTTTLDEF